MNIKNLLVQYDKALRLRMMYPEARKEITKDVVRFVRNAPGMNFIGFTFANEPELERVIDQELEYFVPMRSEEHTSELQSPCNLVCRLLLERKKTPRPHAARSARREWRRRGRPRRGSGR